MDSKTIGYVRHLTAQDRKTLAQKTIKLGEEAGELCKVVLPYENAHGTTHRFIDRTRILEEVCDTVLTAVSVAYDLGFDNDAVAHAEESATAGLSPVTPGGLSDRALLVQRAVGRAADGVTRLRALRTEGVGPGLGSQTVRGLEERAAFDVLAAVCEAVAAARSIAVALAFSEDEVDAMTARKVVKWADLQSREAKARYPLPYEIHITVAASPLEAFQGACAALGVKPIVLDLHMHSGGTVQDVMTSSVFYGDNPGALAEMRRIADGLRAAGMAVTREKIETVPWHPAAPSRAQLDPVMPPNCYFECHFNVLCSDDRRRLLGMIANGCGARLSRNVFKRIDESTFTIMMTYRRHDGTYEDFRNKIEEIKALLAAARFEVEKETVEFSIYDTRTSHDAAWLAGGGETLGTEEPTGPRG